MSRPARSAMSDAVRATTVTGERLLIVVVPVDNAQATVQLDGEVDPLYADDVARILSDQLAQRRRFVTLDLSRVTFLNSAGLRVLALAHEEFLAANGTLVLTGVGHRTARLLAITGLDAELLIVDGLLDERRNRRPGPSATPNG